MTDPSPPADSLQPPTEPMTIKITAAMDEGRAAPYLAHLLELGGSLAQLRPHAYSLLLEEDVVGRQWALGPSGLQGRLPPPLAAAAGPGP